MSRGLQIALVASIILLAAAVAGLGAYLFLAPASARGGEETPAPAVEAPKAAAVEANFFKTKNFVTDLADVDRLRYVDLTIALALKDAESLEVAKKMEPQIRDTVLTQVRRRVAAELAGAEGKARLADLLQTGLEELLKGRLSKVYITDLVVQ